MRNPENERYELERDLALKAAPTRPSLRREALNPMRREKNAERPTPEGGVPYKPTRKDRRQKRLARRRIGLEGLGMVPARMSS